MSNEEENAHLKIHVEPSDRPVAKETVSIQTGNDGKSLFYYIISRSKSHEFINDMHKFDSLLYLTNKRFPCYFAVRSSTSCMSAIY